MDMESLNPVKFNIFVIFSNICIIPKFIPKCSTSKKLHLEEDSLSMTFTLN